MIAQIVWIASIVTFAALTVGLQVDMQAKKSPALAMRVPAPLRNFAQAPIAQNALMGNDPVLALAEAERLVRRRPLPAENLALLAAAQVKAKEVDKAARTVQIAGQRGWREPIAQEAVLRLALAAGDQAEAARRYAALFLRERTPRSLLEELGPAVLGEQGGAGQRTMVAIIVGGQRWHSHFLRGGPQVMPPDAFAAITEESLAAGARFDCGALGQSMRVLARRDRAASERLRVAAANRCPGIGD